MTTPLLLRMFPGIVLSFTGLMVVAMVFIPRPENPTRWVRYGIHALNILIATLMGLAAAVIYLSKHP
jgi:hypothetical protein